MVMEHLEKERIIVVSGLPRSGTSLMMKMLVQGGVESLTDNKRKADDDNKGGYFEYELVKKLKEDNSWLFKAVGKAIKIISFFLYDLPVEYNYKVIFIRRDMDEILASQEQMLVRRGESHNGNDNDEMKGVFLKHIQEVNEWLSTQKNIEILEVSYNKIVEKPDYEVRRVNNFIGGNLDENAMIMSVDKRQYRQRKYG